MTMTRNEVNLAVKQTISDTFDFPIGDIEENTTAEDVDGWDSLQHTILIVRLQKCLNHPISEAIAAESKTVGDLIDRLCASLSIK